MIGESWTNLSRPGTRSAQRESADAARNAGASRGPRRHLAERGISSASRWTTSAGRRRRDRHAVPPLRRPAGSRLPLYDEHTPTSDALIAGAAPLGPAFPPASDARPWRRLLDCLESHAEISGRRGPDGPLGAGQEASSRALVILAAQAAPGLDDELHGSRLRRCCTGEPPGTRGARFDCGPLEGCAQDGTRSSTRSG